MKEKIEYIKRILNKNRKKYLSILILLIIINLLLINIYLTYSYYKDEDGFPFIQATVSDKILGDNDFVLLVFVENVSNTGIGTGEYHLAYGIPQVGYSYNNHSCRFDSNLQYDDTSKTVSVVANKRDVCSIYFDLAINQDLNVKVLLETNPGSNTYELANTIPSSGYTYSHYDCTNNSNITYDDNTKKITLTSIQKDYCNIYFKKSE